MIGAPAVANTGIVPAPSELPQTPAVDVTRHTLDLTFPVADPDNGTHFSDSFLALRGGGSRLHAATDIMAPKHRPIHAAMGGTISFAPYPEPSYGWMIRIDGDDGYRYSYVHLNNDTPERGSDGSWLDDDAGGVEHAYAPKIVEAIRRNGTANGVRVERGELIGFNGDSGNAKGIASHLHLEIHVPARAGQDSYRINPYHSLRAALDRGDVPRDVTPAPISDRMFSDVSLRSEHGAAIERLAEAGILTACVGDRFCPGEPMTRGDLAVAVAAASELPVLASATPRFHDVSPRDDRAAAIAAVDRADILHGYQDNTFGPNEPLSRAQLASMLVRAFELPPVSTPPPFTDVGANATHAQEIATTHAAGLTKGCNDDGTRYCGARHVTRGQLASFLDRALNR